MSDEPLPPDVGGSETLGGSPAPPEPATAPNPDVPLAQPTKSKISFVSTDNSLTFVVPHTGFRGAAAFFLLFGLFWDGISVPMLLAFLWGALKERSFLDFIPVIFLLGFVLIGVLMLLVSLQFAFRKAVLLGTAEELVFSQTGPLRKSERVWPRNQLAAVRVGDSGTVINGRRLQEVKIKGADGTERGMFEGHTDEEMGWIVDALQRFYGLNAESKSAA